MIVLLEYRLSHLAEMPSSKLISLLMPDTQFGQFSQIRQLNLSVCRWKSLSRIFMCDLILTINYRTLAINLSTCPCSKLSVLLSSLSSSDLPFSPYTWKEMSASVPALGKSDVQIHKDQGCSEENQIILSSFLCYCDRKVHVLFPLFWHFAK